MRCDPLRRVLVVLVVGLLIPPAALFSQQSPSSLDSWRISSLTGVVTIKRPGAAEGVIAQSSTLIEEGCELSTTKSGNVTVRSEDGSAIQLAELTRAKFTQPSADANGNGAGIITLLAGHADFHFRPERGNPYKVEVADATVTSSGKSEFQLSFVSGKVQAFVSAGAIQLSAQSDSVTLTKGRFLEYQPTADAEAPRSHARVVRLSFVSGKVMVKRPGQTQEDPAIVNLPIQEGFELITPANSYAEVEFENGSTARLGESSRLLFHQLALDSEGNKLNGITFEEGYATFHLLPDGQSATLSKPFGEKGVLLLQHALGDFYRVKVADATVTAAGKCEFRTDLVQDRFRVEVFSGSVNVVSFTQSAKLGEGQVLEHESGNAELASNIQKGIVKDQWDQWTDARDKQAQYLGKSGAMEAVGPTYGWNDLSTYGEWISLPGGGVGWSPYTQAGWSPYTNGMWDWYQGFGWTWVSGEPWGWLPYHCGAWDFEADFGWFWQVPMYGCGFWYPSFVNWFGGSGWVGWTPGRPQPHPPGASHPLPPHRPPVHMNILARGVVSVPTSTLQNREMITPQNITRLEPTAETRIAGPPFGLSPPIANGAASTAITGKPAPAAAPSPTVAAAAGKSLAWHAASAPSALLMEGLVSKKSLQFAEREGHFGRQSVHASEGTMLGGRYLIPPASGGLHALFRGGGTSKSNVVGGTASHPRGGSGPTIISRGQSGGGSGRASSSSGGGGHGGGGYSGGSIGSGGGGSHSGGAPGGGGGGHH